MKEIDESSNLQDFIEQMIRDAAPFTTRTRSIRVRDAVTSIRLENSFWRILAEIAVIRRVSLPRLVASLIIADGVNGTVNRTSLLRVICLQYLRSKAQPNAPSRLAIQSGWSACAAHIPICNHPKSPENPTSKPGDGAPD